MGQRGPKPVPIETLRLIGSSAERKSRRVGEIPVTPGDPEPPDWLTEEAVAQWNRMVDRMRGQQVLSPNWRESLAQFCAVWVEYEKWQRLCDQEHDPESAVFDRRDKAFDRAMKLGREFGYTPSSKTALRVETQPQQNSKSRFIKGG